MTAQELEQLIQAVPNWKTKSSQEILVALQQENIPFENNEKFTWQGVGLVYIPETGQRFGREGCKLLQNALTNNNEIWAVTQLATGMVLTDNEIQTVLYFLDSVQVVPGARYVAKEVKRNISLLEKARIQERIEKFHIELQIPSITEIESCVAHMKLVLLSQFRIEQALDRVQAFKEAWTEYIDNKGVGEEPEF